MGHERETYEILEEAGQLYDRYLQLTALTQIPTQDDTPEFAAPLPAPLGLSLGID